MPKKEPKYLLWWDCETTGLDHVVDPIVEVAVLVTDMHLNEIEGKRFHTLVDPGSWGMERLFGNAYVMEMHTKNGLVDEMKRGLPMLLEGAESSIIAMVKHLPDVEEGAVLLAGSGVAAFDKQVIAAQMPRLNEVLDYRTIDVGHLRRFLKNVVDISDDLMPSQADDNHRAQGDVLNALEQARGMKNLLLNAVYNPPEN